MRSPLLVPLLAASLTLNAMYGAIAGVLVPAQIARLDPEGKELSLAVIMTLSSLITLLVHPAAGALSDRTRSRWGRRAPWIGGAAVGSAVAMVALGRAETVLAVGVGWLVLQPLLNVVEAPLDAVVADRIEPDARPRAAAFFGGGAAVGLAIGAAVAGAASAHAPALLTVLAAALVVVMLSFAALIARRPSASVQPRGPSLPLRAAWSSPNLRRVFAARFVLVLGQQLVMGYLLYIVMAFTASSPDEAGGTVSLLIGGHILCIVISALLVGRRVGRRRVPWILGATLLIGAALLVPLLAPNLAGLAIYAALAGIGRGVYLTADLALMIDVLPSSGDRARDLGVLGLATIVPQTLAPAIAGTLLTVTGNAYWLLFAAASVAAFASIPVIAHVDERVAEGEPITP